jgi:hypothetical protein
MYKRYILTVVVGIIALLLGLRTGSSVNASQSQARNEDQEKLLITRSFDQWKYEATQVGSEIYIRISSQISGKSALRGLMTEHKEQQHKLFQSAPQGSIQHIAVTIIMRDRLAPKISLVLSRSMVSRCNHIH